MLCFELCISCAWQWKYHMNTLETICHFNISYCTMYTHTRESCLYTLYKLHRPLVVVVLYSCIDIWSNTWQYKVTMFFSWICFFKIYKQYHNELPTDNMFSNPGTWNHQICCFLSKCFLTSDIERGKQIVSVPRFHLHYCLKFMWSPMWLYLCQGPVTLNLVAWQLDLCFFCTRLRNCVVIILFKFEFWGLSSPGQLCANATVVRPPWCHPALFDWTN